MRVVAYRVLAALFAVVALAEGVDHATESAAPHRVHVLGHSVVSVALVVGLLSQVHRSRPPAGLQLLAVVGACAGLGDLVGQRFGGLEVIYAVFLAVLLAVRPGRSDVWQRPGSFDAPTAWLGTVVLLAVAPYFVHESALQRRLVDPVHPDFGYWSWAGTAPLVLGVALLVASLRTGGAQLLQWVSALGLLAFGVLSLVLPHEPASWGVAGGLGGVAGAAVVAWTAGVGRTLRSGERRLVPAA